MGVLYRYYQRVTCENVGGIPAGIIQNVADLLENDIARTMISNCEFIQMLNQAPLDRKDLAMLLNISPTQLSHITNAEPALALSIQGPR